MAVPIRSIIMAFAVLGLIFYAAVLAIGSFAQANNLPLNNTIQTQYLLLTGNLSSIPKSNQSVIYPLLGLQNTIATLQQNLQNGNIVSAAISSVSLVASFFTSIPALFSIFAQFMGTPFTWIGVPATFATVIGYLIIVAGIAIAIISAIFLFPI